MICKNCGQELADGSMYCYKCGTVFEEEDLNAVPKNQTIQSNEIRQADTANEFPQTNQQVFEQNQQTFQSNQQVFEQNQQAFQPNQPVSKPQKSGMLIKIGALTLGVILIALIITYSVLVFSNDEIDFFSVRTYDPEPSVYLIYLSSPQDELSDGTKVYDVNTPMINANYYFSGLYKGDEILIELINEDLNVTVHQVPLKIENNITRDGWVEFGKPSEYDWAAGKYNIEILFNDEKMAEESFVITGTNSKEMAEAIEYQKLINKTIVGKWSSNERYLGVEFFDDRTYKFVYDANGEIVNESGKYGFIDNKLYFDDKSDPLEFRIYSNESMEITMDGIRDEFIRIDSFDEIEQHANGDSTSSNSTSNNSPTSTVKSVEVDGNKVKDIVSFVDGSEWTATGREFDVKEGYVKNVQNFPMIQDFKENGTGITFGPGDYIEFYDIDQSGKKDRIISNNYIVDSNKEEGCFIKSHNYLVTVTVNEQEVQTVISNTYFAEGEYLYRYFILDNVPASNIYEYRRVK